MMNASPLTSWEGAEAYFTFADNPTVIMFILLVAIIVTAGAIVLTAAHESDSYRDYQ